MRIFFLTLFVALTVSAFPQKKGNELLDSLLHELKIAKEDTNKVKLLTSISQSYVSINPKEGFQYAGSGLQLAQKLQWKRGVADLNNSLGLLTGDTGNNAEARHYFEKSFDINKELDAKPFMIANMNNIGRSYQRETNFTKASEYYFKAFAIAEESGNNERAAMLGTNITALYITQQDYQKASEYATITIRKGEAANALIHVAKAYELLGVIKLEEKDTIAAKANFEKALSIDEKLDNKIAAVSVLTNLGTADADPAKQIAVFLRVQKIVDEIAPASQNAILNLANLGLNYYTLGMSKSGVERKKYFDSAEIYLKRGEVLCTATNNPEYTADIKQVMANVQEARGNYKAALENFKSFTAINDSIFSQDNKNKIAALESRNQIEKKNLEIEKQKLQVRGEKKNIFILFTGLLLMSAIGFLFYRLSATRKQKNKELTKLNKELDDANKLKAKFFGILSHDLRSPIANLVNFLNLRKMKPDALSKEQVEERENKIGNSAQSVLETMENMLLWSKSQMQHFKAEKKPVKIDDLFFYIQKMFVNNETISFRFFHKTEMYFETDENYLKTIMYNLTNNSVKALTGISNGKIEWRARMENNKLFLSITDNGPGVINDNIKALYDETYISSAKHGLGMHIIRDLAKAIDCNIIAESKPNEGTTFMLIFA
ncbi:MAG: tetratricopeptide repeat protein [Bacteroidetes bacterium]|nr:tetratricopeptide repeat protein [Bacteroidota bacterium]